MRSTTSKTSEKSRKTTGSDYEFEISFVPLPDEKRAEWQMAMELLTEIILKAIAEHEELLQVNNVTEPVKLDTP